MNETIQNQPGVFVPAQVLGHPALNPAIVYTWMQLRLLVGDQEESAPIDLQELAAYTGRSASTLYDHLAVLRRVALVRQYYQAPGQLVFSFPAAVQSGKWDSSPENWNTPPAPVQETGADSGKLENSAAIDSGKLDSSPENWNAPPAPVQKIGADSEKLENDPTLDSGKLDSNPENWNVPPIPVQETGADSGKLESSPEIWNPPRKTGICSEKPESSPENRNPALSLKPLNNINNLNINQEEVLREGQIQKTGPDSRNLEKEAVKAYRATLGLRPNQAQRAAIAEYVKDLELWQATLEHWQMHGWNPKNVLGILEIYARDGPQGCRFCRKEKPATGLAALALMREELARGERA